MSDIDDFVKEVEASRALERSSRPLDAAKQGPDERREAAARLIVLGQYVATKASGKVELDTQINNYEPSSGFGGFLRRRRLIEVIPAWNLLPAHSGGGDDISTGGDSLAVASASNGVALDPNGVLIRYGGISDETIRLDGVEAFEIDWFYGSERRSPRPLDALEQNVAMVRGHLVDFVRRHPVIEL